MVDMPVGERRIYEVNGWYTDDPASPDLRAPTTAAERARRFFVLHFQ
jgi:hypothetical protein